MKSGRICFFCPCRGNGRFQETKTSQSGPQANETISLPVCASTHKKKNGLFKTNTRNPNSGSLRIHSKKKRSELGLRVFVLNKLFLKLFLINLDLQSGPLANETISHCESALPLKEKRKKGGVGQASSRITWGYARIECGLPTGTRVQKVCDNKKRRGKKMSATWGIAQR